MNKRYRLLVVDKEERVLRAIKSIFRDEYDVQVAHSASKALAILSRCPIDVILSDSKTRLVNDGDFIIKVKKEHPLVRRLLMTVSMDPNVIAANIKNSNIFGYISKPWNIDKLRALVHKAANTSPLLLKSVDDSEIVNDSKGLNKDDSSEPTRLRTQDAENKTKQPAIVVVDDDQRVRGFMVDIARKFSLKVYFAQSYAQAARIITMIPEVGVVAFGVSDQAQKTLSAIELLQRQRDDLSMIALSDTDDIKTAVDVANKGKVFRYLHRLANIESFQRTVFFAIRHHRMIKQSKTLKQYHQYSNGQLANAKSSVSHEPTVLISAKQSNENVVKYNNSVVSKPQFGVLSESKQHHGSQKVLDKHPSFILVGKDQKTRNYVRVISRNLGMHFYSVNSYAQAVRTCMARSEIGVVVLDLSENAKEAYKALTLFEQHNSLINVIAMVNYSNSQTAVELVDQGKLFRYLQKPMNSLEFERAIRAATKRYHMLKGMDSLGKQRDLELQNNMSIANEESKSSVTNIVRLKEFFRKTA